LREIGQARSTLILLKKKKPILLKRKRIQLRKCSILLQSFERNWILESFEKSFLAILEIRLASFERIELIPTEIRLVILERSSEILATTENLLVIPLESSESLERTANLPGTLENLAAILETEKLIQSGTLERIAEIQFQRT